MRRVVRRLRLVAGLALLPAMTIAQTPPKAAAQVRAARLAQNAAIAARRLDSVASFWLDDVVITASLGRVLRGKEAYRLALLRDSLMVFERTPSRIDVASPWRNAWEEGTWVGRQGVGGPIVIRGRYAAQWRQVGERWLIRSELFVGLACAGVACDWPLVVP